MTLEEAFNLAVAHHQAGRLAQAEPLYRQILTANPKHAGALHLLGTIASQTGHHEAAVDLMRQAIAVQNNVPDYYGNLGNALQALGNIDEAILSYEQALRLQPHFAAALKNLANAYKTKGRFEEAIVQYKKLLAMNPDDADKHYHIALCYRDYEKREDAAHHFRRCLELQPEDPFGTRLLLAGMGFEAMPKQAPDAQMQLLYAGRAESWDQKSKYNGHILVADAFNQLCTIPMPDVADAGCGTGLVGALIRSKVRRLEGIDLSLPMLKKAGSKGIYDHLHHGDIVTYLATKPASFDAITCAATLIHFGDLEPAFRAAATALREGGLLLCTLFPNDNETDESGVALAQSDGIAVGGCYSHGRNYIRNIAKKTGFSVELLDTHIHEYDKQQEPVMGLVVALRKMG